ncbi:MAG: hypothetical protein LBF95_00035 [Treponema sp.]|jgi:hypothetical protein|nr:hypothetical protein [Treponema sp.]
MKKMTSALFAGFFCAALAANVFAGGRTQSQSTGGALPVVKVFSYFGIKGLFENTYWSKIMEEDLGIRLENTQYTTELLMTTLASGNIPADLFMSQQYNYVENAIQAGLLYNLDDAKAKLPNLYANLAASLAYFRDNVNGGKTGTYAFGANVTKTPPTVGTLNDGPYTRWDYYRELGYPEIVEFEDYLDVLKKMQDAHPVNADGQRQYGIIAFTDWDSMYASFPSIALGFNGKREVGFLEVEGNGPAVGTILDDDSAYKRGVKFLFRANQMGILDPASVSQTYSEYNAKMNAGRGFFSPWSWSFQGFNTPDNNAQGIGYRLVPFRNQKMVRAGANYIGSSWSWAVVKNAKNLDKALALTDYLASYDGYWTYYNGRKGERWDLDANGEPYYTKLGWDIQTNAVVVPEMDRFNIGGAFVAPFAPQVVHPVYKRRADGADWIEKPEITGTSALSTIEADWRKVMGAKDDVELFNKWNIVIDSALAPLAPLPDNIQSINTRVGQVIAPMSWQAILAKDEAEFETIWKNMVTEAKGRGFDQSVQWYREAWAQALATGSRYMY